MPFLPVLPEQKASAEVKKIYEYVTRRWGFLPNYFEALGHEPQLLQDQVNLYTNAMHDERGLPKIIKEQIATVVSGINMSSYCLPAHLEILGRMGMDKSLVAPAVYRLQVGDPRFKGCGAVKVLRETHHQPLRHAAS